MILTESIRYLTNWGRFGSNIRISLFAQLIINVFHDLGKDLWNVAEDEWMEFLKFLIERL